MTDPYKEMYNAAKMRQQVVREMDRNSTLARIESLKDDFRKMSACFIDARETGNDMAKQLREMIAVYTDQKKAFEELMGRDLASVLRVENVEANEVESDDAFATLLKRINNERDPRSRDRIAGKANSVLWQTIEGWNSKLDKLKSVTVTSGATEAEQDAAARRMIRIEEIIAALKRRGETLRKVHEQTIDELEKFIARSKKNWATKM